jgi:inosose dehydratase
MHIRLASAPVSWGVLLKDTPNVPPYGPVLDEIRAAGYAGTELGPYGYMPMQADRLRRELAERGLTLLSAYVQVNLSDPQANQAVYDEAMQVTHFLHEMGCQWMVLSDLLFAPDSRSKRAGRIRPEDGLQGQAWTAFVRNAQAFARQMREEYGLKTVYHPHVGAWVESPQEVDRFLSETDPDLIGLCLDTGHAMYGGDDPVDLCRRWGSRVRYLHLKDCSQPIRQRVLASDGDYFDGVKAGVFPELGKGSVDFPALLKVLDGLNFDGWAVVEQDILPGTGADPLASAKRNLAYLRSIGIG